jgi:hypothetical protein
LTRCLLRLAFAGGYRDSRVAARRTGAHLGRDIDSFGDLLVGRAQPLRGSHVSVDAPGALRNVCNCNRDQVLDLAGKRAIFEYGLAEICEGLRHFRLEVAQFLTMLRCILNIKIGHDGLLSDRQDDDPHD